MENAHGGHTVMSSLKQAATAFPVLWERSLNKLGGGGNRLEWTAEKQEN